MYFNHYTVIKSGVVKNKTIIGLKYIKSGVKVVERR